MGRRDDTTREVRDAATLSHRRKLDRACSWSQSRAGDVPAWSPEVAGVVRRVRILRDQGILHELAGKQQGEGYEYHLLVIGIDLRC
jgi:hypothetical protein